jgi:hypothetical protein
MKGGNQKRRGAQWACIRPECLRANPARPHTNLSIYGSFNWKTCFISAQCTTQRSFAYDNLVSGCRKASLVVAFFLPARRHPVCNSSVGHCHFFGRTTTGPTTQGVSPQDMTRPLFLISTHATFSNEIFVSHRACLRMNLISIFVRCSCYLLL